MKTKEQKVENYSNLYYAKRNIERHLNEGWFVYTCVSHNSDNIEDNGILVIYEKELENWN